MKANVISVSLHSKQHEFQRRSTVKKHTTVHGNRMAIWNWFGHKREFFFLFCAYGAKTKDMNFIGKTTVLKKVFHLKKYLYWFLNLPLKNKGRKATPHQAYIFNVTKSCAHPLNYIYNFQILCVVPNLCVKWKQVSMRSVRICTCWVISLGLEFSRLIYWISRITVNGRNSRKPFCHVIYITTVSNRVTLNNWWSYILLDAQHQ